MYAIVLYSYYIEELIFVRVCADARSTKKYILDNFESAIRIEDTETYEIFEISTVEYNKVTSTLKNHVDTSEDYDVYAFVCEIDNGDLLKVQNNIFELIQKLNSHE